MTASRKAKGLRRPSRRRSLRAIGATAVLCCALIATVGCRPSKHPKAFLGDPEPATYINQASRISFPDVEDPGLPVDTFNTEPRRLRNSRADEVWDVSLAETIHLALMNSRLIRSSATFMSSGNPVFANPEYMASTLDPAIQETGVLFGRRGVEAALSDFDAQFTSSMTWGKNASIQNNRFTSGGIDPGDTLVQETSEFSTGLQKRLANGAQIGVLHNWNYSSNNASQRLFTSAYDGVLRAEYRQPLLAGAGVEFTRIAGPISSNLFGVSGVQQGVIIARINNDIALADFEKGVHSLLHDVETLYWQLHLAYRTLDIEERLLAETAQAWNVVDERTEVQGPGGGALENAEARDLCFETEARLLAARDALYSKEAELRRLIGLPVNDGRIIRPIDEPVSAELLPDWNLSLCEALARRPELRRQKWVVKSLELQRRAADNLTRPRLDLVGGYHLNGFGDHLLGPNNGGMPGQNLGNAYDDLLKGDRDGWNVGVEFAVPVGKRFALAQVRNIELQQAKAQIVLEDQEREVSHEIAAVFRALDLKYLVARNAYNRWLTADDRYQAVLNQYHSDSRRMTIETLVRARDALGRAELQYVQALIEYNGAILELHYRTGRLPEIDGVTLSEGPWEKAAYRDARKRWIERKYAFDNEHLSTEPEELSGMQPPAEP